jgi:hypothetical protein
MTLYRLHGILLARHRDISGMSCTKVIGEGIPWPGRPGGTARAGRAIPRRPEARATCGQALAGVRLPVITEYVAPAMAAPTTGASQNSHS